MKISKSKEQLFTDSGAVDVEKIQEIVHQSYMKGGWVGEWPDDFRERFLSDERDIGDFDIHIRTRRALVRENYTTVSDLVRRPLSDLLQVRNFGVHSMVELLNIIISNDNADRPRIHAGWYGDRLP